jgi:hypothetical protein
MDKALGIGQFGTVTQCADALGISRQAVYKWPDPLPVAIQDRIIATLVRQGRSIPRELISSGLDRQPAAAANDEAAAA